MSITKAFRFMREVRQEANKISWPGLKQTRSMTIMVFIIAVLVALYLLAIDVAIGSALSFLLNL